MKIVILLIEFSQEKKLKENMRNGIIAKFEYGWNDGLLKKKITPGGGLGSLLLGLGDRILC